MMISRNAMSSLMDTRPRPGVPVATVSVVAALPFLKVLEAEDAEVAARRGEELAALLSRHGLTPEALSGPDARLSHEAALEVASFFAEAARCEAIAIRAVKLWRLGDHGLMDYVSATSATVLELLRGMGRYAALLHDGVRLVIEEHDDLVSLTFAMRPELRRHPWLVETAFGRIAVELHRSFDGAVEAAPVAARFTHAAPRYADEYSELFPRALEFGADVDALTFSRAFATRCLPSADPVLHDILCRQADDLLRERPRPISLLDRVSAVISEQLASGSVDQQRVARRIGTSPATLRRRLELEHGTRFSDVLDQMRRERAAKLLKESEMTIDEIAYLNGFSQVPGFYRAFKRWFRCTPVQYRRARTRMA